MPDFDFSSLITDRSQADVDNLQSLLSTPLSDWTAEQLAAFNQAISKGAYNYTDLNRVTACMDYLNERLTAAGYVTGYHPIIVHPATSPEPVGPLPEGYTELEYIESAGTQYIDTGIVATGGFQTIFDLAVLSLTDTLATLLGAHNDQAPYGRNFIALSSNLSQLGAGDGYSNFAALPINTRTTLNVSNIFLDMFAEINGESLTLDPAAPVTNQYSGNSLYLFYSHGGSQWFQPSVSRLYGCKITINNDLVRDFVPCTDPSGAVGLYDLVGAQFYGNAGSGTFTAGPEVSPPTPVPEPMDPYTWYESDIPTASTMAAYLSNVAALRGVLAVWADTPAVPEDMTGLTQSKANDIEIILGVIETLINNMAAAWFFSGDLYSGEAEA